MRHTILIATLSSIAASVLTTVVIGGSLFGVGTASSANTPVEAEGEVSPGGVEGIIQGDVDCGKSVTPVDSLKVLRHDAGLSVQQDEPCPDIGTVIPAGDGVPGPQGPQGEEGPQGEPGPQGEQGPAGINLWATVNDDGKLIRGTATGATRSETGVYLVTFDQDVDECAPMANPGLTEAGMSFASDAIASTIVDVFADNEVAVIFQNPLDRIDTDFHLIVVC